MFCDLYWNVFVYLDLPCAPLLEENLRDTIHSTGMRVFIVWVVYSAFFCNLYKIIVIARVKNEINAERKLSLVNFT